MGVCQLDREYHLGKHRLFAFGLTGSYPKPEDDPCGPPAMANGPCRMHGGNSTGPRRAEGLERSKRANWKHGYYPGEAQAMRRLIRWLLRESQFLMEKV